MLSFLLSTLWIAIFSYFMVWMVSRVLIALLFNKKTSCNLLQDLSSSELRGNVASGEFSRDVHEFKLEGLFFFFHSYFQLLPYLAVQANNNKPLGALFVPSAVIKTLSEDTVVTAHILVLSLDLVFSRSHDFNCGKQQIFVC